MHQKRLHLNLKIKGSEKGFNNYLGIKSRRSRNSSWTRQTINYENICDKYYTEFIS